MIEDLLNTLAADGGPNPGARRLLGRLLDPLLLENVGIPGSVEEACFAAIDLAGPVVGELRLLADGLLSALARENEGGVPRMPYIRPSAAFRVA